MAADGTDERRLTDSPGEDDLQPNWGSRGRTAFTSDHDGDTEIYTMRGDGSKVRKLTSNKLNDEFANWSANGRTLLFHRTDANDNFDVYRVRASGRREQRVTTSPRGGGGSSPVARRPADRIRRRGRYGSGHLHDAPGRRRSEEPDAGQGWGARARLAAKAVIVPGADGFDWSSAGIAVAALVGLLVVSAAVIGALRDRRKQ